MGNVELGAFAVDSSSLARRVPRWAWLIAAAVLLAVTANRWGSQLTAWLAPATVLVLARHLAGWRQWLAGGAAVTAGTLLQVGKIITEPIPPAIFLLFGLPAVAGTLAFMGVYRLAHRRGGELAALYGAPALVALLDWATFRFSELGAWSTSTQTQLDNVALLQLTSVVGMAGVSFLMTWVSAAGVALIDAVDPRRMMVHLAAPFVVLLGVNLWGSARVHTASTGPTVTVGAVVTDLGMSSAGLPSREALETNEQALFARTELAARRGAAVVVWNEAATLVDAPDETRLVQRGQAEARRLGVDVVLAYGAIASREPLLFHNRSVWIGSDGEILQRYGKHHPVPGEPSIQDTAPLAVVERPWGRSAQAICYDYDFPAMGRQHALLGAGLVVVPSSDWKGIDPYHTQVTRVRAIEGGFSVVRPVRWATSAAYDQYGRLRGALSPWEDNERVLVVTVPVTRIPTLYAAVGDVPVVGLSTALVLAVGLAVARGGRRR